MSELSKIMVNSVEYDVKDQYSRDNKADKTDVYTKSQTYHKDEVDESVEAEATERQQTDLNLSKDILSVAIENTASGSIASFEDGGDGLAMKSLVVNIEPKQEGTGDPSPQNIRPISGTDEVRANDSGINLWGGETLANDIYNATTYRTLDTTNKTITFSPVGVDGHRFTPLGMFKANTRYTIILSLQNATIARSNIGVHYTDGTVAFIPISETTKHIKVYTTASGKSVAYLGAYNSGGDTVLYYDECGVFEGVKTETDFVPYVGYSKSITLPQTVYGGTLDVVSGKLVIDSAKITYDGTLPIALVNWAPSSNGVGWAYGYIRSNNKLVSNDIVPKIVSNKLKTSSYNNLINGTNTDAIGVYNNTEYGIFIRTSDKTLTTVEAINAYLSANPIEVVYELATPTEIELTPTEVKSLLGDNNIWADAGTVDVEYRADTKKYIDLKVAELQALILENIGG